MIKSRASRIAVAFLLAAMLAGGIYVAAAARATYRADVPEGILHPAGRLAVTAKRLDAADARAALTGGQRTLSNVADRIRVGAMEFRGRVSTAPARGKPAPLSPQVLELLQIARELTKQTHGAFDLTATGAADLWRRADRPDQAPTQAQIDAARAAGGWGRVTIQGADLKFTGPAFPLDLAQAESAFAVDKAIHALTGEGVLGGMAAMGGATRCFGTSSDAAGWPVNVPDPFANGSPLATLALDKGGVYTFSSYDRLALIGGRRVCMNVDPRTGRLADAPASATVVAPSATIACGWARALTVLGPEGLHLVGGATGIEAMIVVGTKDHWTWTATPGFEKLLSSPPAASRRRAVPPPTPPGSQPASTSRPAPATGPRP